MHSPTRGDRARDQTTRRRHPTLQVFDVWLEDGQTCQEASTMTEARWARIEIQWEDGQYLTIGRSDVERMEKASLIVQELANAIRIAHALVSLKGVVDNL